MEYILEQIEPGIKHPIFILLDRDGVIVGRKTVVSLSNYNLVSRRHASFYKMYDEWYIKDMGSLNNLYLNKHQISGSYKKLKIGDVIGFGIPFVSIKGGFVCQFKARKKIKTENSSPCKSDSQKPCQTPTNKSMINISNSESHISELSSNNFDITESQPSLEEFQIIKELKQNFNNQDAINISDSDGYVRELSSNNCDISVCQLKVREEIKTQNFSPPCKSDNQNPTNPGMINKFFSESSIAEISSNNCDITESHPNLKEFQIIKELKQNFTNKDTINNSNSDSYVRELSSNNCDISFCQLKAREEIKTESFSPPCKSDYQSPTNQGMINISNSESCIPEFSSNICNTTESQPNLEEFHTLSKYNQNSTNQTDCESYIKKFSSINYDITKSRLNSEVFSQNNFKKIKTIKNGYELTKCKSNVITPKSCVPHKSIVTCKNFSNLISFTNYNVPLPNMYNSLLKFEQNIRKFSSYGYETLPEISVILSNKAIKCKKEEMLNSLNSRNELASIDDVGNINSETVKEKNDPDLNLTMQKSLVEIIDKYNNEVRKARPDVEIKFNNKKANLTDLNTSLLNQKVPKLKRKKQNICRNKKDAKKKITALNNNKKVISQPNKFSLNNKPKNSLVSQNSETSISESYNLKKCFVLLRRLPFRDTSPENSSETPFPKKAITDSQHILKDCSVRLVRCDSKISHLPAGKKVNRKDPSKQYKSNIKGIHKNKDSKKRQSVCSNSSLFDDDKKNRNKLKSVPMNSGIKQNLKNYKDLKSLEQVKTDSSKVQSKALKNKVFNSERFKSKSFSFSTISSNDGNLYLKNHVLTKQIQQPSYFLFQKPLILSLHRKSEKIQLRHNKERNRNSLKLLNSDKTVVPSSSYSSLSTNSSKPNSNFNENVRSMVNSIFNRRRKYTFYRKPNHCSSRMGFLLELDQEASSRKDLDSSVADKNQAMLNKITEYDAEKLELEIPELANIDQQCCKATNHSPNVDFLDVTITNNISSKSVSKNGSNDEACEIVPINELENNILTSNQSANVSLPCVDSLNVTITNNILSKSIFENQFEDQPYEILRIIEPANNILVSTNNKNIAIIEPFKNDELIRQEQSHLFYNSLSIIKRIIEWNPLWLSELRDAHSVPIVANRSAHLSLSFNSYDDYFSAFLSATVLDIWHSMLKRETQIRLHKVKDCDQFYCMIISRVEKNQMTLLKGSAYMNKFVSNRITEGSVVLLEYLDSQRDVNTRIFGYILSCKVSNLKNISKQLPKNDEKTNMAKLWEFEIYVKSETNFAANTVLFAQVVFNIKEKLQKMDALCTFQYSPFRDVVLNPKKEFFYLCKPDSKISLEEFIERIKEKILEFHLPPKIFMIQGAPGTGKTHSALKLLEKLLFHSTCKIKILVVSPSDCAVDEIGLRLVELNERYNWRSKSIKFVRMGNFEKVHPKLQPYVFDKMVAKMCKSHCRKDLHKELELNRLESKIKDLFQDVGTNPSFEKLNTFYNLTEQFRFLKDQYEKELDEISQTPPHNCTENSCSHLYCTLHGACIQYKASILNDADVILSPLSDCVRSVVTSMSTQNCSVPFTCCILDGADQCSEVDVLQCLTLGIGKLVLIGDVMPETFKIKHKSSKAAAYNRSMFERLQTFFQKSTFKNSVFTLTKQYRMNSEICFFPSAYFYNKSLLTSVDIDNRNNLHPLKPYVVIDVVNDQSMGSYDKTDSDQLVLTYLCSLIRQNLPSATVGVISESDKVPVYDVSLSQNSQCPDIEVKTVDYFYSREKDIIIVSCCQPLGANDLVSCVSKLKVAITRARQSLIVYGHISSLNHYDHWKALLTDAKSRNVYTSVSSLMHVPLILNEVILKPRN